MTTGKYHSDYRNHRYELVYEIIEKEIAIKVTMDCRTTTAHQFRIRIGFKQYDVILTREQSNQC